MSSRTEYKNNNEVLKNRYSPLEYFTLGFSLVFTKLFYKGAKLISYPVYMRGKKGFEYGKGLSIGYGCRFDLLNTSRVTFRVGRNCDLGDHCHIVACNDVQIGDNFLSGSKVFISDVNHGRYKGVNCATPDIPPKERELEISRVSIGNNVWIGDNVVILPGTVIGNGCVVGANAVVNGRFEDNSIIAGVPAKVIKKYDSVIKQWVRV